jgi:hypothetical protein
VDVARARADVVLPPLEVSIHARIERAASERTAPEAFAERHAEGTRLALADAADEAARALSQIGAGQPSVR